VYVLFMVKKDKSNDGSLTEYLYCQSCKKFQRFKDKVCSQCANPFEDQANKESLDANGKHGWWQASDGKWYPPEEKVAEVEKIDYSHLPPPPPSAAKEDSDSTLVLKVGILLGGAMIAAGTLLPFETLGGGLISINRTAFQLGANLKLTVDGPIILLLGLIGAGIGLSLLTNTKMPSLVQSSPIIVGLGAALDTGFIWAGINGNVNDLHSQGFAASIGTGFWITAVGVVLTIVSGISLKASR